MMKVVLVLTILACLICVALADSDQRFKEFQRKNGRKYKNEAEEKQRLTNFEKNAELVEKNNKKFKAGQATYKLGLNRFSDLTHAEVVHQYTGYVPPELDAGGFINGSVPASPTPLIRRLTPSVKAPAVPDSVDWRTSGSVSPVKNQRQCGSCWAFTALAAVESHVFIKNKRFTVLSEQHLVDCTLRNAKYFNAGCEGGTTSKAFTFMKLNPGVATSKSYPYEGTDTNGCRKGTLGLAGLKGFVSLGQDEEAIKTAVATVGPVATAMHVSDEFMNYESGVYNEPDCSKSVNHAVLIVGYGTENGKQFWLVKNSWGAEWGEKGYFRIERGSNYCGIGMYSSYPLLL